jgi:GGDEF domain-containing protein
LRFGDRVARLGGDEFTVLLEDLPRIEDAILVAERIKQSLAEPFQIEGNEFSLPQVLE